MITDDNIFDLLVEVDKHFHKDICFNDACAIIQGVNMVEKPKNGNELRKLVFQYAQRLANS